ncbi:MAG: HIT family protein [Bacilli bacterium]|nr:HIT family protein [Bacilli bacterium]MBN2696265.1 HIT family protein [Bacilli bacterium]
MDCIFCRIVSGEIPSYKIYEDENLIAILDISQSTKGHTLIIAKEHVRNLYELDSKTAAKIFQIVPLLANAIKKAFDPIGMNLLVNVEKPLQSVFHFHIHLIPRYENDGVNMEFANNMNKLSQADYLETLARIKENI